MITPRAFGHWERDFDALSEQDCRRLLASRTLGRVGLTSGALPVIMPVEYVYDDGVIVFRTGQDAKLRAAEQGDVLAFEVDAFDAETGVGWSVHVLGRATVVTAEGRVGLLPALDGARKGEQHHYVRLHCEIVTGQRLTASGS